MKKKLLTIALSVVMALSIFCFAGCGNRSVFDTKYTFDYAYIKLGDSWIDVEIKSWRDYDGEQIQITLIDGTTLLLSSVNCVLHDGELPKTR